MAQGECIIKSCDRVAQISGPNQGYCCSLCGVTDPARHAMICNMIEEAAELDLEAGDQDHIVLGYN